MFIGARKEVCWLFGMTEATVAREDVRNDEGVKVTDMGDLGVAVESGEK